MAHRSIGAGRRWHRSGGHDDQRRRRRDADRRSDLVSNERLERPDYIVVTTDTPGWVNAPIAGSAVGMSASDNLCVIIAAGST